MNPQYQTAMRDAISKVIETMFFATALYEAAEEPLAGEAQPYHFESSIVIYGGTLELTVFCLSTDRFARMLTANFLGVDEDELSVDEIGDAMKELANMVAGEFAVKLGQGSWQLGIPGFEEMRPALKHYPGLNLATLRLYDDDGSLALAACRQVNISK
jgi:CheY-specific phosphatase CheX